MTDDINMAEIIENGIKAARNTIKTCDLVLTRMVDMYVFALGDGSVLHEDGIHAFGVKIDGVAKSRDRKKMEAALANLKAGNPDNSAVQNLKIMSWKEAARCQRAVAEDVLASFEELKKAP